MSVARTIAVIAVAVLLTTTVASANAVVVTHRTVLSPDFVTGTLEAENGYELLDDTVQQALRSSLQSRTAGSGGPGSSELLAGVVDRAVTRDYVRSQVDGILVELYAFLHGKRQELTLRIQTAPVVERVPVAAENEIRNASLATLVETANTSSPGEASLGATGVGPSELTRLARNGSSYRKVRAEFRDAIREEAIATAANRTYRNASHDALLALVIEDYDPTAYTEAEKEELVENREPEIKTALRERIRTDRSDRINRTVDDRLRTLSEGTTPVEEPRNVTQAARNLQAVLVQGLAGDLSYSTFDRRLTAAKGDFGRQLGQRLQGRLDEQLPATISPTEGMDAGTLERLERAQRFVGILDALGVALPLFALALGGLLWWLTRSPPTVATVTGVSLFVAGVPTWAVAEWAAGRAPTVLGENAAEMPEAGRELALGLVGAVTGTIAAQSLIIGVIGAGVFVLGVGLRRRNPP